MRWYGGDADRARGYVQAGNDCSTCKPQGRTPQRNFDLLADAQNAAAPLNAARAEREKASGIPRKDPHVILEHLR
jgi:hypothetical protein